MIKRILLLVFLLTALTFGANEISMSVSSGDTLYAVVHRTSDGYIWNGSTFEVPADLSWGTYDLPMTDVGGDFYYVSMPVVAAGNYVVKVYQQTGGSPSRTADILMGSDVMLWDGTAEVTTRVVGTVVDSILVDTTAIEVDTTSIESKVDTVIADTNELQTDWADGGRLDLLLDGVKSVTDTFGFTGSYVNAQIKATDNIDLTALQKTSVNTEVVDVIRTDTIAEMAQGAPPAAPTLSQMLNYLYRAYRNKTETTATTIKIYDNAGSTVLFQCTIGDDGTTFTKAEYGTGS